ncbi:MAG: response regulator [Terriglobales bacterium]|jgi:two-component system response regulator (stage 0 sporulation protein F)
MKTVLFVDDHEVLARLSCAILRSQGYRAVSAYNAAEALEKFDREKFDILVTDWKMDGMDGLELARRIHIKNPQVPIILVTGYGPVDGGRHVKICVAKDELFPSLIEKIKLCLGQTELPPATDEGPIEKAG